MAFLAASLRFGTFDRVENLALLDFGCDRGLALALSAPRHHRIDLSLVELASREPQLALQVLLHRRCGQCEGNRVFVAVPIGPLGVKRPGLRGFVDVVQRLAPASIRGQDQSEGEEPGCHGAILLGICNGIVGALEGQPLTQCCEVPAGALAIEDLVGPLRRLVGCSEVTPSFVGH